MTQVLSFPVLMPDEKIKFALRVARKEYGLSVLEAATALDMSAAAFESLEQSRDIDERSLEAYKRKFELFNGISGGQAGRNLVFGTFPLRVAREILGLSIEEMAQRWGYRLNTWKKLESNTRPLPAERLEEIEQEVRKRLVNVCSLQA